LFAGKDQGRADQQRVSSGTKRSRKLTVNKSNLLNKFLTDEVRHELDGSIEQNSIVDMMDGHARSSSGTDGYHSKLSIPMPRHTLQNFQIARLSAKKQSKPKGKQYANRTASGT